MAIRMTGLASGMDTESIINALMEVKKTKKTKIENKKTKLEWTQTIWSGLNTKLYSFYKDYASKLRFQSGYQTKKATVSDGTKVTATAGNGAAKGSYSLKISQLATSQYVTGGKLSKYTTTDSDGNQVEQNVSKTTKLADLGFKTDGSSQIQVTSGGKTVALSVDADTTVDDFVKTLQSAGLNASFDEGQGRFFIGAANSGADNGFTITENTLSSGQSTARTALLKSVDYDNLSASQKSTVKDILNNLQLSTEKDKETTAITSLQEIADATAKTNATSYYTQMRTSSYENQYFEKEVGADGVEVYKKDANGDRILTEAGKKALEESGQDNDTNTDGDRAKIVEKLISTKVSKEIASEEYQTKIADAVENGFADANIQSKATRDAAISSALTDYTASVKDGIAEDASASSLAKLGLAKIDGSAQAETSEGSMVVIAAQDAKVTLNGATLTSSSNTMSVNGLELTLSGVTTENVNITVADDKSAVYDSIKEFINQYNSVLSEMNTYYYAASARDYDVLSDDEKEKMSDTEVEKWEKKIKDSLLRRDTTLGSVLDGMKSAMTSTVITASNGKKYSLANLGITTGTDYKEYGLLHIKGDEDDTVYADSTNTLDELLNEDPDVVAEVMSGIAKNLYDTMTKQMGTTRLSSALTFYNDKEMNSQLSEYKKDISDWEEKLADIEDRYYSQFSKMETAMAKLNSQQNTFTNYLG